MSDKKNIDRLFQEEFKDFEVQPPMSSWDAIEKKLDQKKKRRVIPLWWKLGGIAAAIAIIFTSIYIGSYRDTNDSTDTLVNSEKEIIKDSNSQKSFKNDNQIINNESQIHSENTNNDSQLATEDSTIDTGSLNRSTQNSKVNTRATAQIRKSNLITSGDGSSDANLIAREKAIESYERNLKNNSSNNISLRESIVNSDPIKGNPLKSKTNSDRNTATTDGVAIQNKLKNHSDFKDDLNNQNKKIEDTIIDSAVTVVDSTKKTLPTLEEIAAQEEVRDSIKENAFKGKWAATTQVGPVYSNSLSGSALNSDVRENNRDAGFNISYGIGISYEISPRLSVRTGINQVNMSYSTQDINYQVNVDIYARSQSVTQVYDVNSVRNATPVNNNSPNSNDGIGTGFAAQEFNTNDFQGIKGELSQQLGYIEVPLELKYNLINSKFKINILGGMSALFLTDNVVAVQNPSERLELGEDRNFNEFNQSANFGLGLGYDFTNQLGAFIEPTFKYQLNTLRNNMADFRPYTIGIQSGVMYRF